MEYEQALTWVHGLPRLVKSPGLARMEKLLQALGNPQGLLRFVHVVGTNGKGSAAAMTASILKEAGYRTGLNLSPFVLDFRERFLIDGEMIAPERLAAVLTQVRAAAETLDEPIKEFEAVTAAALLYFAEEKCDIVCLEAGIGGHSDTTNVVRNTLVAYVMNIGLDHTALLGDTVSAIAAEKCGIFKNQCDVISYPDQPDGVKAVVRRKAEAAGCALTVPNLEDFYFYDGQPFENRVNYGGYDLVVPLPGLHQALNAAVAVEGALALWRHGFAIEDQHITKGIEKTRFPARIEIVSRQPLIIVDGAHNRQAAEVLAQTLKREEVGRMSVVMGVLGDKPAGEILEQIRPFTATLYAVTPDSPRAVPAAQLAATARATFAEVVECDSVADALAMAKGDGNGVLVCGSLYLAAQARALLVKA